MTKPVTLKEIAQKTGLSVATVGRVFASPEKVKQSTIDAVTLISEQLNYRPNLAGKSLRTGKSYEIAMMLPFDRKDSASAMGAGQYNLISSFMSNLSSSGYSLKLLPYTNKHEAKQLFDDYLRNNTPDAFVVTQLEPLDERVNRLEQLNIPFITFGKSNTERPHNYFDYDNFLFAYQATRNALDNDAKKVILLTLNDNYIHYLLQISGYEDALKTYDSEVESCIVRVDANDDSSTLAKIEVVLDSADTVITVSPHLVYLTKKAAKNMGIVIGRNLSIVCSSASPSLLQMLEIPITCYYQDFAKAGSILSESALQLSNNKNSDIISILEPYEVIDIHG